MLFIARQSFASEIEPRSYVNTPVGINFLLAGYGHLDGNIPTEYSSPIQDAQLAVNSELIAYVRTLDLWGKSAKFDVILPYSELSGTARVNNIPVERNISGFSDPRFRFSYNFYGAPALTPKEFTNYQQDVIIGGSIQISAPLGQYDNEKLVNLGNNRWFVKPDLGISKAWRALAVELSTGAFFFSNNDDYFGGKMLKQDPVSSTQLHVTYNFGQNVWAAISGTFDYGGRTTVNDVSQNDLYNNLRVGATLAWSINRHNSIKLYASDSLHTTTGPNFYLYGIGWQYRWGNGL